MLGTSRCGRRSFVKHQVWRSQSFLLSAVAITARWPCAVARSTAWTFRATTRRPAQLTQVQPRRIDWAIGVLGLPFQTAGHTVPHPTRVHGKREPTARRRGDPQLLAPSGQPELVFDLSITHDRFGSSSHVQLKGLLSHPQDLDAPLRLATQRKINSYRQQYDDNQNIFFLPSILSISTRMHGDFLLLLFLQAQCEHWTAIAKPPIGQRVPVQAHGILPVTQEQSRPRGGKSGGVADQPQCRGVAKWPPQCTLLHALPFFSPSSILKE